MPSNGFIRSTSISAEGLRGNLQIESMIRLQVFHGVATRVESLGDVGMMDEELHTIRIRTVAFLSELMETGCRITRRFSDRGF